MRTEILKSKSRQVAFQMTLHEPGSAEHARLVEKHNAIESDLQAELSAQAAGQVFANDGESAEVRKLTGKAKMQGYVSAVMAGRSPQGAEAELNAAYQIEQPDHFPLTMLDPASWQPQMAKTDADAGTRQANWLDRLFADTAARHLGVTFQSVAPGISSHPVTTAGAAADQLGRTEKVGDAAWTVGVTEMKPARNSVRAVFTDEDMFRLPGLEAALRRDLGMALTEGIDRAIFLGDTGANENSADVAGLVGITAKAGGFSEVTLKQEDKVKAGNTLAAFAGMIDGKHASSMADLNVVASVGANTLWLSTIASAAADTKTLAQFMRENGLSWRTRGEIETATAAADFGAFIGKRRGLAGAGIAAIWQSGRLIRDIYSKADTGECSLTLATFWNFALVRESNFARLKFVA